MFSNYWQSLSPEEKEQLAKSTGTTVSYLRHVATGFHKAGAKLASKLHEATGGKVNKAELRPDYFA
ncbi:hypothetical protein [Vibrio rumoiensis]|uniref:hypothetical protein n=1 Tax=Vibrio rumoiensis TaxID=76258 RepID=UPI003AA93AC4